MDSEQPMRGDVVRLAVLFEGGLAVLACALGWAIGVPPWQHLHGSLVDVGLGFVAALPMLVLLVVCAHLPWGPLQRIEEFIDKVVRPLFRPCTVADLALVALVAGLGEELLFRGLLQDALGQWLEIWGAVAVTAVLFGLMHAITPAYIVLATLAGGYLGWVYVASGNLLTAVVAHAFYDFAALVYLLRGTRPAGGEPVTPG
jgi:membrane protease YdiL (CAAX protease family)